MNTHLVDLHQRDQDGPTNAADVIGSAYVETVSADHRRNHGLYLTPPEVARFMGTLIGSVRKTLRLLDPAAGAGILICGVVEALAASPSPPDLIEVTAYEVDQALAADLKRSMAFLASWSARRGIRLVVDVRVQDFVLANADAMEGLGGLFSLEPARTFDAVISNPPYFKLNKSDPRAQAALSVVHGQPNIYGLFMAISAALLRPQGDFVFITPRSFASGPYFRAFRERFFELMRPELIHVFGSRRDAFSRDEVLQENVILHAVRDDGWRGGSIRLSTSSGVQGLSTPDVRSVAAHEVFDHTSRDRVLRMPATSYDGDIMKLVDAWPGSLAAHGWKISTGPVVPFRAVEFQSMEGGEDFVPLLWMNHVKPMQVTWPIARRKPEHILDSVNTLKILVPNANYVLMRRFSAKEEKRRLVAAPYLATGFDAQRVGLENHLNYIHCPGDSLSADEAFGLAALLNSTLLDTWFRAVNGNTQVSATELRSMPLPTKAKIIEIGRRTRNVTDLDEIDMIVEAALGHC